MDAFSLFGASALSLMVACYAFERLSHWLVLGFALATAALALYFLIAGWIVLASVTAIWAFVALRRWQRRRLAGTALL
jgi:uncharacterized membrane protein HdeD (DUF308 family)